MFVTVTIKRKSGKHVKAFNINGAQNIEQVLFFIWRDLFLSMLAAHELDSTRTYPLWGQKVLP